MLCDDHLHTAPHSPDARMGLDEACRAAIAAGVDRITVTEHLSCKNYTDSELRRAARAWEYNHSLGALLEFKDAIEKKRGEYPELGIGFGIEADYHEGAEGELKELLDGAGFDFVLGSVHFIGGNLTLHLNKYPYALEGTTPGDFVAAYFSKMEKAARSGLFDCLAHLDVFKRNAPDALAKTECGEAVRSLARVMASKGLGFEFNTAQHRNAVPDYHPSREDRAILSECGVRLATIGSDAHRAEHVGFKCREARDTAKSEGFQTVYFEKRRPVPY